MVGADDDDDVDNDDTRYDDDDDDDDGLVMAPVADPWEAGEGAISPRKKPEKYFLNVSENK